MNFHVIVPCGEDSHEGDLPGLFEFHRSCRLRRKIIQHAVNSRNHGEILSYFTFQTVLCELLLKNGVGLANGFQTIPCDCTRAANAQTRSRERLTVVHLMRQPQLISHHANLVLEQNSNRLHLASSANTSINSFPIIILFFSGSSTPASLSG